MSNETPPVPSPGPHNLATQRAEMPGCGIAAYALVLFTIFLGGVTGVVTAYSSLIDASKTGSPTNMSYGGNISPPLLGPMRGVGLLAKDEVPDVFHTENILGTEACAISRGKLHRLDQHGPRSVELTSITAVEETPTAVIAKGPTEIVCPFGEGEGGDRFARILDAARQPAPTPGG